LPPGKQVSSSIQGLASAVDVTERKVDGSISKFEKRLWNLNVIVYVTVITVAISVSTYFIGVVNFQRAAYETNLELRNKVSTLEAEDSSLQLRISNLEQKLSLQNNEQRLGTPAQKRK